MSTHRNSYTNCTSCSKSVLLKLEGSVLNRISSAFVPPTRKKNSGRKEFPVKPRAKGNNFENCVLRNLFLRFDESMVTDKNLLSTTATGLYRSIDKSKHFTVEMRTVSNKTFMLVKVN